jgi:site-specific recombinase XerD
MLTTYLKRPSTQVRYRSSPAGPYFDGFVDWLEAQGYQPDRIRRLLRGVDRFARWASQGGLSARELDAQALEAFGQALDNQQRLRYPSGNSSHLFVGACRFVTFLAVSGQVASSAAIRPASADPRLVLEFRHWMHTHRGTTTATLNNYRLTLLDLLETLGDQPAQYDARAIRAFVLDRAQRPGIEHAKTVVTAARMFLRFLIAVGRCSPGLDHAIPTIARWRLASLPRYLSAEVVERVLASCHRTTLIGIRDRAVLLLLARLGLRAGDVVALRCRDIDWREGTVQVAGKNRRRTRLPLPQEVGDAILLYLADRPAVDYDPIFLTTVAPFKGLTYQTVGQIATRAMHCAGVETPQTGSHVLRHSAATQMLRHGMPLSAIGAVLRHASIETTAGYAKVDLPLLQEVVKPWPEVTPC